MKWSLPGADTRRVVITSEACLRLLAFSRIFNQKPVKFMQVKGDCNRHHGPSLDHLLVIEKRMLQSVTEGRAEAKEITVREHLHPQKDVSWGRRRLRP